MNHDKELCNTRKHSLNTVAANLPDVTSQLKIFGRTTIAYVGSKQLIATCGEKCKAVIVKPSYFKYERGVLVLKFLFEI